MAPAIAAALIAAAPSVIKGISGLFGSGKGKLRALQNTRPIEQVNSNIVKNNAMAEKMANEGLPAEQYNNILQGVNRNLSGGIRTLGRSANPSAGLNSLVRAQNDAILSLGSQDAQAKINNRRFAFGTRTALANEQNRVFDWNKRQKYLEEANAAAGQIGAGRQNAMGALTDLSQLGQAYITGQGETSSVPVNNSLPANSYGRYKNWSRRGV